MRLEHFIGDEENTLIQHRILNILLIVGIVFGLISTLVNCLIGLDKFVSILSGGVTVILSVYYTVSLKLNKQKAVTNCTVLTLMFVFTPALWFSNGGLLGASVFAVLFFSSAIALVLTGFHRIVTIGSLIVVLMVLVMVEYHFPALVMGYNDNFTRYADLSVNLILTLIANASAFALVMHFYNKEQLKAREYLLLAEQQKMDNTLSRLDRLNIIGEMAASIGHEVRNPLTTVRGYLQYFQTKGMYPQHQEHFLTMIEEIDRANAIITEFLALAKNKSVDLEMHNINDSIMGLLPLLQADASHTSHELNVDLGEIPELKLDKKDIRQLLLNLIRNAMEATPPGGQVVIRTRVVNGQVTLSVQDNGPGIAPEILDKLGTPFTTTKENGTGLGLPVCYRIVERHNARMDIETGPGGTTFCITFCAQ